MTRPVLGSVTVETKLKTELVVRCDPLLLVTALDNLIRNAIEAVVAAKDLGRQPSPWVRIATDADGDSAWVAVEDNAGGPPASFEGQLFQPFVTSKPKGIGLGLSMARQAVEQQGGRLGFERTEKGSRTFRAAMALFAQENNWGWPDPTWPLMPRAERDFFKLVKEVPRENLR